MTDDEFVFFNDGLKLCGTLTRPRGHGPAPAVVLISGSGANDRDETVCGQKPFSVIANYAYSRGYAALRFDDRGVGASSGNSASTTFSDSVSDAAAAAHALANAPGIDAERLALIGHSEGGLVSAAASLQGIRIQAIVMLASPAEPIEGLLHWQARVISEESGATDAQIAHEHAMNTAAFEIARSDVGQDEALARIGAIIQTFLNAWPERLHWSCEEIAEAARHMAGVVGSPAYRSLLVQEPETLLRAVEKPILGLFGALDTQVAAERNQAAFAASTSGNRHASSHIFARLNHLFQPAITGSILEYEHLPPGPDAAALDKMFGWLDDTLNRD